MAGNSISREVSTAGTFTQTTWDAPRVGTARHVRPRRLRTIRGLAGGVPCRVSPSSRTGQAKPRRNRGFIGGASTPVLSADVRRRCAAQIIRTEAQPPQLRSYTGYRLLHSVFSCRDFQKVRPPNRRAGPLLRFSATSALKPSAGADLLPPASISRPVRRSSRQIAVLV